MAGLDTIPDDEKPPVAIVFWSFRVMVGLGFAMLGLAAFAFVARRRGTLYTLTWLHRLALVMGPTGFITERRRSPHAASSPALLPHAPEPLR